jgi:hypothetical protein
MTKILKNTEVCYPDNEIWFICWDDKKTDITAYGSILPSQCLETTWSQIDYYNKESTWLEILIKNNKTPLIDTETEINN